MDFYLSILKSRSLSKTVIRTPAQNSVIVAPVVEVNPRINNTIIIKEKAKFNYVNGRIAANIYKYGRENVSNPVFGRNDATNIVKKLQAEYPTHSFRPVVAMQLSEGGDHNCMLWKTMNMVHPDDDLHFHTDFYDNENYAVENIFDDQIYFNEFHITLVPNTAMGATTNMNNCLANILVANKGRKMFIDAKMLKSELGLEENDLVPIDENTIIHLENYLELNINLIGDRIRVSSGGYTRTVNVVASGGHAEIVENTDPEYVSFRKMPTNETFRIMLIYKYIKSNEFQIVSYKNKIPRTINTQTFCRIKREQIKDINVGKYALWKCPSKVDIVKYVSMLEDYQFVLNPMHIQLYNFESISDLAVRLFQSKLGGIKMRKPDIIEAEFLDRACANGGLTHHKKGVYENAITYDVNSSYARPWMDSAKFPLNPGELVDSATIKPIVDEIRRTQGMKNDERTNALNALKEGLYSVKNPPISILIRNAKIYSRKDLLIAIRCDVEHKMELVDVSMVWDDDEMMDGKSIFSGFLKVVLPLKEDVRSKTARNLGRELIVRLYGSTMKKAHMDESNVSKQIKNEDIVVGGRYKDNNDSFVFTQPRLIPKRVMLPQLGIYTLVQSRQHMRELIFMATDGDTTFSNVVRVQVDSISTTNVDILTKKLRDKKWINTIKTGKLSVESRGKMIIKSHGIYCVEKIDNLSIPKRVRC